MRCSVASDFRLTGRDSMLLFFREYSMRVGRHRLLTARVSALPAHVRVHRDQSTIKRDQKPPQPMKEERKTEGTRQEPHWMMHDQTNQGGRQNYHRVAAEVLDEERAGPLISLALIVFPTKRSYLPIPKVPGVRTRMTRSRCRATALAL